MNLRLCRQLKVVYEQGPNGREAIYGIGEVAAHEVGEDKLKTFIESEVMGM